MKNILAIVSGVIILVVLGVVGFSLTAVDVGERAIEVRLGKVVAEHDAGIVLYNPLTTNLVVFDVREKLQSYENIPAYTKDAQAVSVGVAINFYPDRASMTKFYEEYGVGYEAKIVPPIIESLTKEVVGKFNAVQMVTDREKLQGEIERRINSALKEKNIHLTKLSITSVQLNKAFSDAVEQKVIAVQEAEKAKNITQRIEEEAKQKIISAEAEAKAMKIKSEALKANKALVEYNAVNKWNGELPKIMLGNGSLPFINVGGLSSNK